MAVTYVDLPHVIRIPSLTPRMAAYFALCATALAASLFTFIVWSLVYDPKYALGRQVMAHHTSVLQFEVAGHNYEVRSPNIPLSLEQTDAYWYYAGKMGYPVYAADGPMAVDP